MFLKHMYLNVLASFLCACIRLEDNVSLQPSGQSVPARSPLCPCPGQFSPFSTLVVLFRRRKEHRRTCFSSLTAFNVDSLILQKNLKGFNREIKRLPVCICLKKQTFDLSCHQKVWYFLSSFRAVVSLGLKLILETFLSLARFCV